jgi:hypothetical protein
MGRGMVPQRTLIRSLAAIWHHRAAMRSSLCALLVLAACLGTVSAAGAASPPVLGKKGLMPYGTGWGSAHPREIFNGGAPSGGVRHIHWRHWGAATATGSGRAPTYRPGGGYYAKLVRVQLRATRLGRCPGGHRRAYTRLIVREQTRPGGSFGDWFAWTLDLCDFDAEPAPCPPVSFAPERNDGALDLGAWDTDCQTAQAVAAASKGIVFDPGPHADGTGSYRMTSQGFTCSGYSLDDEPKITWGCLRGTAVVRWTVRGL